MYSHLSHINGFLDRFYYSAPGQNGEFPLFWNLITYLFWNLEVPNKLVNQQDSKNDNLSFEVFFSFLESFSCLTLVNKSSGKGKIKLRPEMVERFHLGHITRKPAETCMTLKMLQKSSSNEFSNQ